MNDIFLSMAIAALLIIFTLAITAPLIYPDVPLHNSVLALAAIGSWVVSNLIRGEW